MKKVGGVKRKREGQACYLCEKNGFAGACNGKKPCTRCKLLNMAHMCYGGAVPLQVAEAEATGDQPSPQGVSGITQGLGAVGLSSMAVPEPRSRAGGVRHVAAHLSAARPPVAHAMPAMVTDNRPSPMARTSEEQNSVNSFLLEAMQQLQLEHRRMFDHVKDLKDQNTKLKGEVVSLKTRTRDLIAVKSKGSPPRAKEPPGKPTPASPRASTAVNGERPMVVYDLMKKNTTVLTANNTFCSMLGYPLTEVIGATWLKFIHPDHLSKTIAAIAQTQAMGQAKQVIFDQCYRHRNGATFWTKDTHVLFYDASGFPISAVVSVQLPDTAPLPSLYSNPSPHILSTSPVAIVWPMDATARSPPLRRIKPKPASDSRNLGATFSPSPSPPNSSMALQASPSTSWLQSNLLASSPELDSLVGRPATDGSQPQTQPVTVDPITPVLSPESIFESVDDEALWPFPS